MMIVKDLWQLSITKNFSVVAGANGLNRKIESVEILDFEFATGINHRRETIFNPNSLVLSSLLFAKKDAGLLISTIKKLVELKVSALAYKPVIYKELPPEVLTYANEHGFPILRFGGDEFFETIILEVMNHVKEQNHAVYIEKMMGQFIEEETTEKQIQSFLEKVNNPFDKYIYAASLRPKDSQDGQWKDSFIHLPKSAIVCPYRKSLFILFTDKSSQIDFLKTLKAHMDFYQIPEDGMSIGFSQVHFANTELHLAIREAYYASIMAEIEMKAVCYYEQLGSEKIWIELYRKDAAFARDYIKTQLAKLLDDKELFDTAVSFVLQKGNVKEVAAAHFCHPKRYATDYRKSSKCSRRQAMTLYFMNIYRLPSNCFY